MIINRRAFISATIALALGWTGVAQGAETGRRMVRVRYTWPDGAVSDTVVPESQLRGKARPYRCSFPVSGGMLVGREVGR